MKLSDNALTVLRTRKYFLNSKETIEQFFRRVAKAPKHSKHLEDEYFKLISSLEFLPNTPCLINSGKPNGQLFACFVLPIGDSLKEILKTLTDAARIFQTGGGVGYSFDRLREKGQPVSAKTGTTSGPISFMQMFNGMCEAIKQGGVRRGAQMAVMRIDHPDIEDFISCKIKEGNLANFNISVGVTKKFMDAVKKNSPFSLISPYTKRVTKKVKARELYTKLVKNAWSNGEPGAIFLDEMNKHNPTSSLIEATNPCSEQPLPPYGSCVLGSIDVSKFVNKQGNNFDWERLDKAIRLGVRYLDGLIDTNNYPLPEIKEFAERERRIGLGLMGLADALIKMKKKYNSNNGRAIAKQLVKFFRDVSLEESKKLAEELGTNYNEKEWKGPKRRNATILSIAPTGTLSILAGCSSGIEPNFAWEYVAYRVDKELKEIHPLAVKYQDKDLPEYFVTADQIKPEDHIKMQAVFQEYIDSGISKTINLPFTATEKDVENAYSLAYKLNCKGITVYRDGSRQVQVLNKTKLPTKRPEILVGRTIKRKTGHGNLYVTVNEYEGKPYEVFCALGKSGQNFYANAEGLSRMISLALKNNIPLKEIVKQLRGIGGESPTLTSKGLVKSVPDAFAQILEEYYLNAEQRLEIMENKPEDHCPECNAVLSKQAGCTTCSKCGWSRCGN